MFFILLIFYICYHSQNFMMEIWLEQEEYALCENVFSLHHANHQRLKRLISVSMLREVIISYFYYYYYFFYFTILYWFCHTSTCIRYGRTRVPILNPLPPPSPYHPSGSSQCTNPKLPVSSIERGLAIHFLYDIIQVDETGAYYTEWSKPERKTPIQYTNTYI